ncbi:holin [Acinetobacter lwoffii]|uniref:holin n=1 Tax=Acinetobacter lwoffii TaxID=28090 RepID=UPI003F8F7277
MSDQKTAVMEMAATVSSAASKTTYAGAASGFVAWLASVDVLAWMGIALALAGFVVNWYYKRLENKRADEIHQLRIKQWREET